MGEGHLYDTRDFLTGVIAYGRLIYNFEAMIFIPILLILVVSSFDEPSDARYYRLTIRSAAVANASSKG